MSRDEVYLVHVLEGVGRIEQYTESGSRAFECDAKTQDAVVRDLRVRSESIGRISEPAKTQHPEAGWREITPFRNIVVHDDHGIYPNPIWKIAGFDLPGLKCQINKIRQSMGGSD
jgi:uncharacterized protein with HEPN domain